ncbi:hypothetical protein L3Q82_022996 [Scortum barcoo]|uniref:Uncharacterized protein n=1 Tax=Scortum barcoo TaxID=214431 RepID=A0ACB8WYY1_9TELE|nr:hypothetical protein L3Q82_022996 [Scortum barcoo]
MPDTTGCTSDLLNKPKHEAYSEDLFVLELHKYTCNPPNTSTFTLLKKLAEAASLSSDLQRNRDMASRVAALLLLGIICVGFASAEIAVDCCLLSTDKYLPRQVIVSYNVPYKGWKKAVRLPPQQQCMGEKSHSISGQEKTTTVNQPISIQRDAETTLPAQLPDMALWGNAKLFFCILFITSTVTLAQIPIDCCLAVRNQEIDKSLFVDYHQQVQGQGCALNATILLTRRQKKLCVPADEKWVHHVMKHVDALKKLCKRNNKVTCL